jgi:uncharacterized protein (DUF58 family)
VTHALPTQKVVAYGALAASALLAAVVLGDPAVVALAAPFALALVIGILGPVSDPPGATLTVDSERLVEGATVLLTVHVTSLADLRRAELRVAIPAGLDPGSASTRWSLALDPGESEEYEVPLVARSFGRYTLGPVQAQVAGPFGLRMHRVELGDAVTVEVRPLSESTRTLVRARDVRPTAGDQLARRGGDGIEFSEVQPWTPGAPGRLNWRVTARRGAPHISLRTPERSTDVVILVDTFSKGALGRQVRAASGLADAYLRRHDRVGLVGFGGVLHWVEPAMGRPQLNRLVTALAETEWHHSYAWKSADSIPARVLPSTGLVLALSPLDDPRAIQALAAIRARGVDLAVIETPGPDANDLPTPAGELARRIIRLEREELRTNFARRGVAVVPWPEAEPLESTLASLAAWRRHARGRVAR